MRRPSAVFLINLLQDVSVLRPLVFMAARDFGFETLLLVSTRFDARDLFGIWGSELEQIVTATDARIERFEDDWEAHRHLTGHGLLFSASESHLENHAITHNVFRHAPPSYLRVTLQHGFECVGFRHSADHVRAHGETASFAADVLCTWAPADQLASLAPSQRAKVHVTGPSSILQLPTGPVAKSGPRGLVCENLHSVRFSGAANAKSQFVEAFAAFAAQLVEERIVLKPHPGGQYFLKRKLTLPPNVEIENAPTYRLDLREFAYGISAPSSILVEMLLNDIPTAVWRDRGGAVDVSSYEGLTMVSSAAEWAEFARAAERDHEPFVSAQRQFLARTKMPLEPCDVYSRFAELFQAAHRREPRQPGSVAERERILLVADSNDPTLQLSFDRPLEPLVGRGEIATALLTKGDLSNREAKWVNGYLDGYNPSSIIFSRYSGPSHRAILQWARRECVSAIYHVDEDLFGTRDGKALEHSGAVKELLNSVDLVYASTEGVKQWLLDQFPKLAVVVGQIEHSSAVLRQPSSGLVPRVGYLADGDHGDDLRLVLPAIERLLETHPDVHFEVLGLNAIPEELERFGDRISIAPPIANPDNFLEELAKSAWDVGICPLAPVDFNVTKANRKWVQYTAVGAAVVASRGTVYDGCCSAGCGILVGNVDEWFSALDLVVSNEEERIAMAERAQAKLLIEYSPARLREQVLNVIAKGHAAARARSGRGPIKEEERVCQLP
jgi:glycosyltransferase involved in cell wall biosynthesis